ncbi:MMPL family transporter [Actinoplanes sp. Pm04-4]|uniref:MMPL family transporter n=1 Tax=Paractinoplanes pyxinae TaxID=2997416 RepID=A0ABT4BGM0_9ACTN|nr:MMPL family transporter [Actinoplanes pyxinae]MCY1145685.1 MMPL family transporter [Actinoplanes pyxinae]
MGLPGAITVAIAVLMALTVRPALTRAMGRVPPRRGAAARTARSARLGFLDGKSVPS